MRGNSIVVSMIKLELWQRLGNLAPSDQGHTRAWQPAVMLQDLCIVTLLDVRACLISTAGEETDNDMACTGSSIEGFPRISSR